MSWEPPPPTPKLRWPIDTRVWFQVSRSSGGVARLPEGKTGKEALAEALSGQPWEVRSAENMTEGAAGEHYMRCYARQEGLTAELSPRDFNLFRQNQGRTYHIAWLNDFYPTPLEALAAVELDDEEAA